MLRTGVRLADSEYDGVTEGSGGIAWEPRDALHRPLAEGQRELRMEGGGAQPRLVVQQNIIRRVKGVCNPVGPGPNAGSPAEETLTPGASVWTPAAPSAGPTVRYQARLTEVAPAAMAERVTVGQGGAAARAPVRIRGGLEGVSNVWGCSAEDIPTFTGDLLLRRDQKRHVEIREGGRSGPGEQNATRRWGVRARVVPLQQW